VNRDFSKLFFGSSVRPKMVGDLGVLLGIVPLRRILVSAFAASTARATLDVMIPLYAKNGALQQTLMNQF